MSLHERLRIDYSALEEINQVLLDPSNPLIRSLLEVLERYGTPEQINARALEARQLSNLMDKLQSVDNSYLKDIRWLITERDRNTFISILDYRRKVLGDRADGMVFNEAQAVTLEISALQYFPWLVTEARQAIDCGELMPDRFIRVRKMKEQERDQGDLLAVAAAMQVIGATYVETLDTRGTDGSNIHLNGPETITGYFGGVGQPNEHALQWVDEFLYYYTRYGIRQVLNINPGTVLLGYLLHKLGIDMEFKISVFMGNDNPYSVLWTLLTARLFSRPDGSTSLVGLNLSNSVDARTLELSADMRRQLGFEEMVRIEHHVTETYKSIVRQPYNRRTELLEVASKVPNISAKHEGADPEMEEALEHPSDVLDYFRTKEEIVTSGQMGCLERNYIEKHNAVNRTAWALTERGIAFAAASNLHRRT